MGLVTFRVDARPNEDDNHNITYTTTLTKSHAALVDPAVFTNLAIQITYERKDILLCTDTRGEMKHNDYEKVIGSINDLLIKLKVLFQKVIQVNKPKRAVPLNLRQ